MFGFRRRPKPAHYFLHIPKTAGTTFTKSVLPQLFPPAQICPAWCYSQLLAIPPRQRASYRLFCGHFYYFIDRCLPAVPKYMTFLRDPIDRLISDYEYVLRTPSHPGHQETRSVSSFREYATNPNSGRPNVQVRALTADIDPNTFPAGSDLDEAIVRELMAGIPTRQDLELAKQRLANLFFVGIAERFRESVDLLCFAGGWKRLEGYADWNVAPQENRLRREALPPEDLAALREHHNLDYELYRFATGLFDERLRTMER